MPRIEFDNVSKRYAPSSAAVENLSLTIEDGSFLCVLGPSGCGKSSTLRMLAGLESITEGEIRVDGKRYNELKAQSRDFAMVFENYALYPHLDVYGNLAMPLAARKMPRQEIARRVEEIANTLQISDQLRKKPRQLSGGQRQRVGLGRAIIRDTRTFLMDEPLGHLEAYLRQQLRTEIRRLHEELGATTFYITHDQEEAAAISDRIAVMSEGRLQQTGDLLTLLDNPVNRFVAEFIGNLPISILPASIASNAASPELSVGDARIPFSERRASEIADSTRVAAGRLEAGVRPDAVTLHEESARHRLPLRVSVVEPVGDMAVIVADGPAGRLRAAVPSDSAPSPGNSVHAEFDASRILLFDGDGRNILRKT
ncbi:MAG: ABC transporter ATP-binding protein [Albidovulum sp.]|nr:ABC transporter ATP-binding protein [Albidovulum sp.]